jgi:hypothetical protein
MTTDTIKIEDLTPYERNARHHEPVDIDAIAKSIEAFGFRDPVGVWGPNNVIVEGHGRVMAAKQLGMTEVPCIRLDDLTDEQRRAYGLAHNKTAELSTWDAELLPLEVQDLPTYDMTEFGFNISRMGDAWFEQRERMDQARQEGNDEYNEFLDKFEIQKTTDDCYTPDGVYQAVVDWVEKEYGVKPAKMVRPFYPGGDYQHETYPKGCVVVDNPPFSILAEIINFYADRGIKFFLFAPSLTLFSSSSSSSSCCALATGADVIYENGASVATSFLTNLENGGVRVRSAPDLRKAVQDASDKIQKDLHKELPKYSYPDEVITSSIVARWSKYGVDYTLLVKDSVNISALDAQKAEGKAIFGKGYLLSERAAAERAAAERAAAQRWVLSDRERDIVKSLGA